MRTFSALCLTLAIASVAHTALAAPMITEGTAVATDGTRLYYRTAGQGDEVVVAPFALFHRDVFDALATGKRKVVTYDPRGRGRSEKVPLEKVSLDLLLSDLDAVRAAVGAERVSIIGWSGAGMETFVYALRNPSRVERLVQLTPVAPRATYGETMWKDRESRTDKEARTKLQEAEKAGAYKSRDAELCRAWAAIDRPPTLADPATAAKLPDVCVHENEWDANLLPYFGALMKSFDGFDWRPSLAKVAIPRLVVHGEKDNVPLDASREWVEGAANARLLVVKNAGHWPHYEQQRETLDAIRTFLDGGWPQAATPAG